MPPCNQATLSALAQQLAEAANQRDWTQIGRLDDLLVQWLEQPPARDMQLRAAWLQLRRAHEQALQVCREAKVEAAQRLMMLQRKREAQQAYAWQEILG